MNSRLGTLLLILSVTCSSAQKVFFPNVVQPVIAPDVIKSLSDLFNVSTVLDSCTDAKVYNETVLNSVLNSAFFLEYDAMIYIIRSNIAKSINETKQVAQNMIAGDMWSVVSEFGEQYWAFKCDSINKALQIAANGSSGLSWLKTANVSTLVAMANRHHLVPSLKYGLQVALEKVPVPKAIEKMEQIISDASAYAEQNQGFANQNAEGSGIETENSTDHPNRLTESTAEVPSINQINTLRPWILTDKPETPV